MSSPPRDDELARALGMRLVELRAGHRWSMADAAERLGWPVQSLSRFELGRRVPTLPTLIRVADVYGVTVAELMEPVDRLREERG